MMICPKISIIIPVYNVNKDDFRATIECLLTQTLKEIELIFVDDCGVKGVIEVAHAYAVTDARIKIIKNDQNVGSGISRNRGIRVATGEYLAFFDADDLCDSNFYEKLYKASDGGFFEIIKGARKTRFSNGREEVSDLNKKIDVTLAHGNKLFEVFTYEHGTAIYRADFIQRYAISYGDTYASQDTTFLLKATYFCQKFKQITDSYYIYMVRNYSQTQVKNRKYYLAQVEHIRQKVDFLNSVSDFGKESCRYLAAMLVGAFSVYERFLLGSSHSYAFKIECLNRLRTLCYSINERAHIYSYLTKRLKKLLRYGGGMYLCLWTVTKVLRFLLDVRRDRNGSCCLYVFGIKAFSCKK